MRYVSDSAKARKKGKKKTPPPPPPKRRTAPPQPIVTEREGVKVNISAAMRGAQAPNNTGKKFGGDLSSDIIIKVLIALAVALGVFIVMAGIYFLTTDSAQQEDAEQAVGYPVIVGGVNISEKPTAVVSLSPLLSTIVRSLPINDPLAGVSEYCENDEGLPSVGTPLLPDIEAIIELQPRYLLTVTPLTQQQKSTLEQHGCSVLQFDAPTSADIVKALSAELAMMYFGAEDGDAYGTGVYDRFYDDLARISLNLPQERPTYTLMLDMAGYSATPETPEAQILGHILGEVAVAGENYMTTLEQIVVANPGVLIVPDTITPQQIAESELAATTAFTTGNVYYIDMHELENFDPAFIFDLAHIANQVYAR